MSGDAPDLATVYRREVGRCTATLVRLLGDVDLAEDAVAEAFAVAAGRWRVDGVPPNPGGWITTTARNRAVDRLRREAIRDAFTKVRDLETISGTITWTEPGEVKRSKPVLVQVGDNGVLKPWP